MYIQSLRDRPFSTNEKRSSTFSMKHSEVINIKSSTMIHNDQLNDFSQKIIGAEIISPEPSLSKSPVKITTSIASDNSLRFGTEMMLSDIVQDVKSLSLSIGFDSQSSQSPKPLKKPLNKPIHHFQSLEN